MKMVALRWPKHVAVFCKIYIVYMTDSLHAMKGCRKVSRLQLVMSLNPTAEIIASNHYFLFALWRYDPMRVMASSFLKFLDHKQRCTTVGRTPLDE
jgi:hypothetical protein